MDGTGDHPASGDSKKEILLILHSKKEVREINCYATTSLNKSHMHTHHTVPHTASQPSLLRK